MARFSTEAKVGLFVLVAVALLAYMAVKVGRFQVSRDKSILLTASFRTASGLKKDVPVEIAGIEVGQVEDISLQMGRAVVAMRVRPDLALSADTVAMIRTTGVLGDKYIEIIPGATGGPPLVNGDRIVHTRTPAEVDELITKINEITVDIKAVTESLNTVFGGEEGVANLRQILKNLRDASESASAVIADNRENLNAIVKNLAVFSEDMRTISSSRRDDIETILANLSQVSKELSRTIEAIGSIADKINNGEGTLGQLVNQDTVMKNINETLGQLNEISRKINQGEGALGSLVAGGQASKDVEETLASLRQVTDKINRGEGTVGRLINDDTTAQKIDDALTGVNNVLAKTEAIKVYVDYHTDYLFDLDKARTVVNLRIQPREDRYYLVGVVDDPRGVYSKEITRVRTSGGGDTRTTEETWDQSALRFNAQLAKRYRDLTVRAGIIESTGGFGLDYHLFGDSLRFNFETYDFSREDLKPHLRLATNLFFFNFFYARAGYDDFLNPDQRSLFFGLGIMFSDDDLKYLLSSVPIPTGK